MNNKIKVIALFGKSASGKDTIKEKLLDELSDISHRIVSFKTRPTRDGEVEDVDYFFVTEEEFTKYVVTNILIEATSFKSWFYGTDFSALDKDALNIGVFNVTAIEALLEDPRLDVLPVYIESSDKIRLLRSLNREKHPDCAEICRRFQADEKDFCDIPFDYITFVNNKELRKHSFYNLYKSIIHFILSKID